MLAGMSDQNLLLGLRLIACITRGPRRDGDPCPDMCGGTLRWPRYQFCLTPIINQMLEQQRGEKYSGSIFGPKTPQLQCSQCGKKFDI